MKTFSRDEWFGVLDFIKRDKLIMLTIFVFLILFPLVGMALNHAH
jgi:hypothetical protein